jgi:hypothetical protein
MYNKKMESQEFTLYFEYLRLDIDAFQKNEYPRKKFNKATRCFYKGVCTPICCFPCILYSTGFRLGCFVCTFGESFGGVCCGNYVTKRPDECITTCWNGADESINSKFEMKFIASDEKNIVKLKPLFDKFLEVFKDVTLSNQYKMAKWLSDQLNSMGFSKGSILPANVEEVIKTTFI